MAAFHPEKGQNWRDENLIDHQCRNHGQGYELAYHAALG